MSDDVGPRLLTKLVLSAVDSARSQSTSLQWDGAPDDIRRAIDQHVRACVHADEPTG